jgi:ribonucleoside-triphosphate reductase
VYVSVRGRALPVFSYKPGKAAPLFIESLLSLHRNYLEGDVLTHIQLGGSNPGRETLSRFIRAVYDDSVNRQIDFNPEFTFCSSCQKTARGLHETCSYCGSSDVEGIARLTKYFSKVSSWNKGKLAELKNRKINDSFGK